MKAKQIVHFSECKEANDFLRLLEPEEVIDIKFSSVDKDIDILLIYLEDFPDEHL